MWWVGCTPEQFQPAAAAPPAAAPAAVHGAWPPPRVPGMWRRAAAAGPPWRAASVLWPRAPKLLRCGRRLAACRHHKSQRNVVPQHPVVSTNYAYTVFMRCEFMRCEQLCIVCYILAHVLALCCAHGGASSSGASEMRPPPSTLQPAQITQCVHVSYSVRPAASNS